MVIGIRNILLDPYIISARANFAQEDALGFIERIILWRKVHDVTGCQLVVSSKYFGSLWKDQQYPTYDKIQTILKISNTYIYDAPTILRAISYITEICPRIEDILCISELLLDENKTEVTPRELFDRLTPNVAELLCETLASCALYKILSGKECLIGLATVSPTSGEKPNVYGSFTLLTYESEIATDLSLPLDLTLTCPMLISFDDIYDNLEFSSVCYNLEYAIKWSRIHILSREDRGKHPLGSFVIRPEFRARIRSKNETLLQSICRKIVFLLCGINTAGLEIEPLRIDIGANSPQRIRAIDNAKAFRMQISQHGAGHHVHYWEVPDGPLELAWFGTHNDFFIPE